MPSTIEIPAATGEAPFDGAPPRSHVRGIAEHRVRGFRSRLALPFAFAACDYDVDRAGVSIVECGGKANILLFGCGCRAAGVPFVAIFDLDRGDELVNDAILDIAGRERTVVLAPDFEHVADRQPALPEKP